MKPGDTPTEFQVIVGLDEPDDMEHLRRQVAKRAKLAPDALPPLEVVRRSLDARGGRVRFHLTLRAQGEDGGEHGASSLPDAPVREPERIVIVGDGPAGLFCAHELARQGLGCTVLDRGKPVRPRRRDLKALTQHGQVSTDSNYCFGEGGAGTYSDGKLYTRSHKRGDVRDVLELLHHHGAPDAILTDARPHIGSNRLPKVITSLRESLEARGVRFRFEARVTGVLRDGKGRVRGVHLASGETLSCDAVVVATGHSARDVYLWLADAGVQLEAKGFAVGVRIEHPQPLIDAIQYGKSLGHPKLPAAAYRLAHTDDARGVFSFCMCPGGYIVPAATEPGGVVVNGMSLSRRDSPFANSGLVVGIEPEDVQRAGYHGPLGGVELQRVIEQAAHQAGGEGVRAPATRAPDFLARRGSSTTPATSYQPGLAAGDVGEVLDAARVPHLTARLRQSLRLFGKRMPGYAGQEAVLVGVESRTSAPVRVPRHPESLESLDVPGLYPAGEGAGYAGGIVSAALDGIRVARAIQRHLVGETTFP